MMKLDGLIRRLICALLCAVMIAGLAPAGIPEASAAEAVYGRITKDEVFFRYQPNTTGGYKFKMALNTIVEITKDKGETDWYGIACAEPGQDYASDGYCAAAYLDVLSAAEVNAWLQAGAPATFAPVTVDDELTGEGEEETATPTPVPGPTVQGYVTIIERWLTDGVNLRDGVGGNIKLVWKVSNYVTLPYTEKLDSNWYKVLYEDELYFVDGTVVYECEQDGSELGSSPTPSPTPSPTTAPTLSPVSGGYVTIRSGYNSVNLRQSAGGTYRGMWLRSDYKVLPYSGTPTYKNGYNWYAVDYENKTYYVTGQFVAECDASGNLLTTDQAYPTPTVAPGTIRLTADKVIFRKTPGGAMIRRLAEGTVLPFSDTKSSGGYTWFYVEASDGKKGYIREDVCEVINGTYTESGVVVGYLELIKPGVNLRKKPGGTSQQQLDEGLVLPVLDDIDGEGKGSYTWYKVQAPDGTLGYVRSDCIKITTESGGSSTVATPKPSTGYVMITDNYVKFRKSAAGSFIKYLSDGDVYPLVGLVVDKSGYSWYPIQVGSTVGYVRHDFSIVLNDVQVEAYLKGEAIPSATPTPTGSMASSFLKINADKTYLRAAASKESKAEYQVDAGTVLGYTLKQTVGGVEWYKGVYKNTNVWVMAEYADVMTNDEYNAWLAANPDAEKPTTEVISGYVKTTDSGVNLRKTAGGSVITRLDKGTVMSYSGTEIYRGDIWYYVKSPSGYGYVVEDYAVLTDANGVELPDATPDLSVGGSSDGKIEASYTTLRKGSSGEDVKAMVAELKNQGYWTGDVISSYNDSVVAAVKKFQTAKSLEVDGVAGPNTLHALYGTVPVGTSGMPEMDIYPVEKIDWYTGGIQKLWPKGKNVVIMDVKTGITMWVHRWSGGRHADVEPLTAADTARMCKMYGVSSADQIEAQNLWHRRPLWITIGNRTFCASMFGFAHNYPDGDTISTNNFKGQFCIHFTNSEIHRTEVVDSYHQEAIQEAYEKAPSRK